MFSETIEGLSAQAVKALDMNARIIEFRLDGLASLDFDLLKDLISNTSVPVILSYRSEWNNVAIEPPILGRRELLIKLIELQPDFIDLEFPIDIPLLKQVQEPTRIIISTFDFEGMSKVAINQVIDDLAQQHPNVVVKVSSRPNSVSNLKMLWRWSDQFRKMKIPSVVLGMGQLGQITRIKSREMGNSWTYGRIGKEIGEPFMAGMLDVSTLKQAFSEESWHLGIISDGTTTSLKDIFTPMLANAKLKGVFLDIPIERHPDLDQLLLWIEDGLLDGVFITETWQKEVRSRLNQVDTSVIWTNRCNSVVITKDGLKGYNTEVEGIKRCLEPYSIKRLKRVYIEGVNHLSRSVITAVADTAELIVVRGRSHESITHLQSEFPRVVSSRDSFTEHFDIVINCTLPERGFENVLTIPLSLINNAKVIFDLISTPGGHNPLIQKAEELNLPSINGGDFFANSVINAFELWTNRSVPAASIKIDQFMSNTTSSSNKESPS
ncbi:MAG: type I 3-dehydroquinate dehydratase [Candidatus Kariarchaeaceae archaeon]